MMKAETPRVNANIMRVCEPRPVQTSITVISRLFLIYTIISSDYNVRDVK